MEIRFRATMGLARANNSDTAYLWDLYDGTNWVLRAVPTQRSLDTYNLHGPIVLMGDEMIELLPKGPRFPEL